MSEFPVMLERVTHFYGGKCVLHDVSLRVRRGTITALLGRNGAGKSTALRIVLGAQEPTRGKATVLGHESARVPAEVRGRIGFLAESHPVYGGMTVGEHGRFQAAAFKTWNQKLFDLVVGHFGLPAKQRARTLSRGQRAGLALAMALSPEPELLVLDDPALGLDPVARRLLLESLVFLAKSPGRTILFTSHLLADVERVADWIAVLDGAALRVDCALETFQKRIGRWMLTFAGTPPAVEMGAFPGLIDALRTDEGLQLTFANAGEAMEERLRGMGALSVEAMPLGLEDAFISYVGERKSRVLLQSEIGTVLEAGAV